MFQDDDFYSEKGQSWPTDPNSIENFIWKFLIAGETPQTPAEIGNTLNGKVGKI